MPVRETEVHLFGLSRLPRHAAAGLYCPRLGFLRTRTSQLNVLDGTKNASVSCVPYLVSRSHGIAEFFIESANSSGWLSGGSEPLLEDRTLLMDLLCVGNHPI